MSVDARYTLDEVIEAQSRVIRHVIEFMTRNGRAPRLRQGEKGALVNGTRIVEDELRKVFDFDERLCSCCGRWLAAKHFHRHHQGRAGLYPRCKHCCKLAVIYGGRDKIPPEVLRDVGSKWAMVVVRTGTKV